MLADYYMEWAAKFNLRADILWAQARVETADFKFGGQVKPEDNNFCGLRLKDGSGFFRFSTPLAGVQAHVAHLAWHVYADHVNLYCNTLFDPKHSKHPADMTVVRDLSIWAGGSATYAPGVVARANER